MPEDPKTKEELEAVAKKTILEAVKLFAQTRVFQALVVAGIAWLGGSALWPPFQAAMRGPGAAGPAATHTMAIRVNPIQTTRYVESGFLIACQVATSPEKDGIGLACEVLGRVAPEAAKP